MSKTRVEAVKKGVKYGLFIKPGIQERGIQGTRGMFTMILGNLLKDSGEFSREFGGMLSKILGNAFKDSGVCSE